jgi:CRISPR-associated protein Csh1
MIVDLIEFGGWLSKNKQDEFGKNLNLDGDYLFIIKFNQDLENFEFEDIKPIKDRVPYYNESIYNTYYYITTDQMVIKPSNSNLIGITPFLLKLDHDFLDKANEKDDQKLNKFYKKVERSKNANGNDKEFIELISSIYKNSNDYVSKVPLSSKEINDLVTFFEDFSLEHTKSLIKNYYNWIYENKAFIVDELIKFKEEKGSKALKRSNFYLACHFNSEIDLLNDIFYYYSKFIKKRKENFEEIDDAPCSFCDSNGNVYPSMGDFVMGNAAFSFNYDDNKDTAMKNSRLKFCKTCAIYAMLAEDKLMKILPNNILIIPKRTNGHYGDFLREMSKENSSFEKINKGLDNIDGFNFDLALYTKKKQGKGYVIEKYIENYKSYLARVRNEENKNTNELNKISLYKGDKLEYLSFNETVKPSKNEHPVITNIFEFEQIFKQYFINIRDSKLDYTKLYHFYQIYTRDLRGRTGIVGNLDSKTFTIFSKYMHAIFNLIYELNTDAIDKSMLNEIVLNCLIKITKNMEEPKYLILKRLNYYLMLNKELLGDNMLKKDDVDELKIAISSYDRENPENMTEILELIQKNPSLKYYLIGKFLRLIDSTKYQSGKKQDIFGNFVTNANRNNIKNLFVTEVLQKNNYYIQKMNPKGKLVFNLFESDLNSLFNEETNLSFEDYLLSIFAGYYTENILKKGGD